MVIYTLPACVLLLIASGGLICVPFLQPVFLSVRPVRAAGGGFWSCKAVFDLLMALVCICVLVAVALFTIPFNLIYGLCMRIWLSLGGNTFKLILSIFGQSITVLLVIPCTGLLRRFHRFGSLVRFGLALIGTVPKSTEKIAKNGTRKRLSLISKFSFVHLAQCNL